MQESISISYLEVKRGSGRDLCKLLGENGDKPPPDLQAEIITVNLPEYYVFEISDEARGSSHYHPWAGFSDP